MMQQEQRIQHAKETASRIEELEFIKIKRKPGAIGTITHQEIAAAITRRSGVQFGPKMNWTVPSVEDFGDFTCSVQLCPWVSQSIIVKVVPE